MTVYLPYPDPFDCAICFKPCGSTDGPWLRYSTPSRRHLPPICWFCEQEWGVGPYAADVMLDCRLARQISALAKALHCEADSRASGYGGLYART